MLTERHITLLRNSVVEWNSDEFGAPRINPRRPYSGDKDVARTMIGLLSFPVRSQKDWNIETDEIPDTTYNELVALHERTDIALQIVLSTGAFKPGTYRWPTEPGEEWLLVSEVSEDDPPKGLGYDLSFWLPN